MAFISREYKRFVGKVTTTSDGDKYIHSKMTKCALFRSGFKRTGKLNRLRNFITPIKTHNHAIQHYQDEVFLLYTRCETVAKNSQTLLRKVFDDDTRTDPCAAIISFMVCESSMHRARRTLQTKIPLTATEFCNMLTGIHLSLQISGNTGKSNSRNFIFR